MVRQQSETRRGGTPSPHLFGAHRAHTIAASMLASKRILTSLGTVPLFWVRVWFFRVSWDEPSAGEGESTHIRRRKVAQDSGVFGFGRGFDSARRGEGGRLDLPVSLGGLVEREPFPLFGWELGSSWLFRDSAFGQEPETGSVGTAISAPFPAPLFSAFGVRISPPPSCELYAFPRRARKVRFRSGFRDRARSEFAPPLAPAGTAIVAGIDAARGPGAHQGGDLLLVGEAPAEC